MSPGNVPTKIWRVLSKKQKYGIVVMIFLQLTIALIDTIGFGSLLPITSLLLNPAGNLSLQLIDFLSHFGIAFEKLDKRTFLLIAVSFFATTQIIKIFGIVIQSWFVSYLENNLSVRSLEKYLGLPYDDLIQTHKSIIVKNIVNEVHLAISGGLMPALNLVTAISTCLFIFCILFWYNPIGTFYALAFIGGTYLLIATSLARSILGWGGDREKTLGEKYRLANEALGAVTDLKVRSAEAYASQMYHQYSRRFAQQSALALIAINTPRHFIELLGITALLFATAYLMSRGWPVEEVLLSISVYVAAGYRVLPAAQQIYGSVTQILYSLPALNLVDQVLKPAKINESIPLKSKNQQKQLAELEDITFKNVGFKYPTMEENLFEDLSFTVKRQKINALIGPSGCGKSTAALLAVGLLSPQKGSIYNGKTKLTKSNRLAWWQNISYVPQSSFILNDTVAANIAFGIPAEDIDLDWVIFLSKKVDLHHHITSVLPDGYHSRLGDGGITLSGGQKQRITFARALYSKPKYLFLDETTSALTSSLEHKIFGDIKVDFPDMTIILITHRESSLENVDNIIEVDQATVKTTQIGAS